MIKSLIKKSIFVFGVKVLTALSLLFISVLIANSMSKDEAGQFFLYFSIVNFFMITFRFGADNLLLKRVVSSFKSVEKSYLISLVLLVFSISVFLSLILSVLVYAFGFHLTELLISLISIFFMVITFFISVLFQGRAKNVTSVFIFNFLGSISFLILLFFSEYENHIDALYLFLLSTFTSFCFSLILFFYKIIPDYCMSMFNLRLFPYRLIIKNFPYYYNVTVNQLFQWGPVIAVGFIDPIISADITVSQRITFFFSFVFVTLNHVFSPKISLSVITKDIVTLSKLVKFITRFMLCFSFIAVICLLYWQDDILLLFGQDYLSAKPYLYLYILIQIISVCTGPVGFVLIFSGESDFLKKVTSVVFILLIASFLILYLFDALYFFGSLVLVSTYLNLSMLFKVKKIYNFYPI